MVTSMARKKLTKFALVALAASSMLMLVASTSSATVYRSVSFNLTGHDAYLDTKSWGPSVPSDFFPCYATLTANSGTVQSHRVGIWNVTNGPSWTYSGWTTASVASTIWIGCETYQNTATGQFGTNFMSGEQATSSTVTRNYTMRGIG
jgi:hypothetical protein